MRGGEVVAKGGPEAIMQAEVLSTIYGIPMGILLYSQGGAPVSFVY